MAIVTLAEIDEALVGEIDELLISRHLAEHIMVTLDLSNHVLAEKEVFDASQSRIEALRAASRIVAEGVAVMISRTSKDLTIDDEAVARSTITLADRYVKWLEKGEG